MNMYYEKHFGYSCIIHETGSVVLEETVGVNTVPRMYIQQLAGLKIKSIFISL